MATSIQTAFGAFLLGSTALLALVDEDRDGNPAIYPVRGPQDSKADPYVVWRFMSWHEEEDQENVGGPPAIANTTISISCMSKSYDVAQAVAQVIQGLLRYMPAITGGPIVLGGWITDTRDEDIAELGVFEVIVEAELQLEIS